MKEVRMDYRVFVVNRSRAERGEIVGRWLDLPTTDDIFDMVLESIGAGDFEYALYSCEERFPFSFPDIDIGTLNDLVLLHQQNPHVFLTPPTISNFDIGDGMTVSVVWVGIEEEEDEDEGND